MKKKYIVLLAVTAALCLLLSSCAPLETANGIMGSWREYFRELYAEMRGDWAEFEFPDFSKVPKSVYMPFNIEPDGKGTEANGMDSILIGYPHRETLSDVRSEGQIPTAAGYVRTDCLLGIDVGAAEELLSSAGVNYTVVTEQNPLAEGTVYAVEYAGIGADGGHYINPAVPLTLYVSGEKPRLPENGARTVYLTFDDGPGGEGTAALLDILDSYGIKATFFLVGDSVKKDPEAAKEILLRGHDAACHSMSHDYKSIYASTEALMAEVDEWTALMESLGADFNVMPKMFRYPGGSVSQYLKAKKRELMNEALLERGFRVYDWTVVANDALLFQCPDGMSRHWYIIENFLDTYETAKEKGEPIIVLLHENIPETRAVLPWIIEFLLRDGCTFAPLSDYESQWTFADR